MSQKKADQLLANDLKKDGWSQDKHNSNAFYKGKDEIYTDKLSYSHKDKPFTIHQHTNGKKVK